MRAIRHLLTIGFFLLISNLTFSSSTFYPYTLKLDNGIKIKSIAYRTYDSPDPGMSWVYKNNKLLYTLDKRLTGYIITNETGEILVEIDFSLSDIKIDGHLLNEKGGSVNIDRFSGEAIKIYKHGELEKVFDFKDLLIDTSVVKFNHDQFYWGSISEKIKVPAFIQNDTLRLIAIDTSEIKIALQDLTFAKKQLTDDRYKYFASLKVKRKISVKKHGLPDKFLLPKLESKETIENKLANYLGYQPSDNERDSAKLQIYIHTLLIDKKGKCVQCYVSATRRESTNIDFGHEPDNELKKKIEDWLLNQKYETKLIPGWTDKYGFSDFIYLKE